MAAGAIGAAVTRKRWTLALAVLVVIRGEANRRGLLRAIGQVHWSENQFNA
jgi:hypothetical protein